MKFCKKLFVVHVMGIIAICVSCDHQLRQEKCELEETLEKEQEYQVNKLMRRIEKLQAEVVSKQATLEQVSLNIPR